MNKQLSNWIAPVLIAAIAILALWLPHYLINTSQQTVVLTITLFAILWYTLETRRMQKAVRDQAEAASCQIREITKQTEAIAEQTKTAGLQIHEIVAQTQALTQQTEAITKQTKELIYQRRLSILPKFSVGFTRRQAPFAGKIFDCLELVNIGNGTAVNISVDDIPVMYVEGATARVRFDRLLFLEPTKSNSKIDKAAPIRFIIDHDNSAPETIKTALVQAHYRDEPAKVLQEYAKPKITIVVRFQDIDGTTYAQSAILGLDQDNPYPLELGLPTMQPDNG